MHNNQKYFEYRVKTLKCNHVTKKELSMVINVRPRNMVSEDNTFFKKTFGECKRGAWNISDNSVMS